MNVQVTSSVQPCKQINISSWRVLDTARITRTNTVSNIPVSRRKKEQNKKIFFFSLLRYIPQPLFTIPSALKNKARPRHRACMPAYLACFFLPRVSLSVHRFRDIRYQREWQWCEAWRDRTTVVADPWMATCTKCSK